MITISARDFRESQSKYLKQALDGRDIILYTRDYGSFRIVPLSESDRVYNDQELDAMIDEALADYKDCLLYTSPSPRDISGSRMPSSA